MAAPMREKMDHTLPHSLAGFAGTGADARRIDLEPIQAGVYHLTYACLLLPRFSEHYLTGEVADKLSEWMPIICIAFGWRLEYLAVRPEYLQWVSNVPPATSPGLRHAHYAHTDFGKDLRRLPGAAQRQSFR